MLFDNPALQQLKQKFDSEKVKKEGSVKATDRGFGFLEVDKESYFIAPNDMRSVMHGDRVVAVIENDENGKQRAHPEQLVEPFLSRFVGRILFLKGKTYVVPDHPNIPTRVLADDHRKDRKQKLQNGDWVVCNLTAHALKAQQFRCAITEYICAHDDPKTPWLVTLRSYDLPLSEPEDEDFAFLESNLEREDLTAIPFITIDSAHTEDMDDALYIEKLADGSFRLLTAIADPSGYIAEGSKLDAIAAVRDFSIYLPGHDIPMLPRSLAENLCSLREGEDRPALVGEFTVLPDGTIDFDRTVFKLATVRSHGKLVYNDVSDYIEGRQTGFQPSESIAAILGLLAEFAGVRDNYRATHAATFMNRPDYDFILNPSGALDHIEVNHRRIANQIVEEAMITSNIAAGQLLAKKFDCGIFNSHKGFDLTKKKELISLLEKEHCPYSTETLGTIEGYNAIRRFAVQHNNNYLDSRIRHLQEYSQISIAPAPHFALGVENYATWTSPIRKYGDIINHRLIKSLINSSSHPKMPDEKTLLAMNTARRINRMAERDVCDWLYVDYLEPDIDRKTVFTAEVFDISRGGLRVILQENGAMHFIPFSFISSDKDTLTLDGDNGEALVNNEVVLRLGDTLKVKVISVDKKNRSITGAPAEPVGGLMLPDPYQTRESRNSR